MDLDELAGDAPTGTDGRDAMDEQLLPRDRDSSFEPKIVGKRKRRLSGIDGTRGRVAGPEQYGGTNAPGIRSCSG